MRFWIGAALACLALPAPAAAQRRADVELARQLEALTEPCRTLDRPRMDTRMHVLNYGSHARDLLDWMLGLDPARCPGMAQAAAARIDAEVGTPERPNVPVEYLELARRSAAEGLGRRRDPAMAERYRRMLWLFNFDDRLDFPDWPPAARQQWLERPETVALLAGRLALSEEGEWRQSRMLAALRLRRDRPYYDPQHALLLFARAYDREGQADLLSDGIHMPPDFRRAGQILFDTIGGLIGDYDTQAALLRVGRRALAAATTAEQRGDAVRILFAASIEGRDNSCTDAGAALQSFRRGRLVSLSPAETEQIGEEMYGKFDPILVTDEPASPRPTVLRALVDPGGRLIHAEVDQSSGSVDRDRSVLHGWARYAERVDLSASTRGRFTWVKLPAVPPLRPLTVTRGPPRGSLCR
jgi:hypothetical protein